LLWVYYSAQIFLYGAEFTRAYADVRAAKPVSVEPEESQETRAAQ
jgi:membrane protein